MPEHPTDAHFSFTFVFKQALRMLVYALSLSPALKFSRAATEVGGMDCIRAQTVRLRLSVCTRLTGRIIAPR